MHWELLLRLVVGTALGGVIGYERERHGRPAGLRTHTIVALASTTFMLVSTHFVYFQHSVKDDLVAVDPSRIAASVVTGIGFLGGGAILRTGLSVQGLTTAAGLWLVAAIGLSAGAGMFVVSVAATVLGMLALVVMRRAERKDDGTVRRRISLIFDETAPAGDAVLTALRGAGVQASAGEYEHAIDERRIRMTFNARVPAATPDRLVSVLEAQPGIRRITIESLG